MSILLIYRGQTSFDGFGFVFYNQHFLLNSLLNDYEHIFLCLKIMKNRDWYPHPFTYCNDGFLNFESEVMDLEIYSKMRISVLI